MRRKMIYWQSKRGGDRNRKRRKSRKRRKKSQRTRGGVGDS